MSESHTVRVAVAGDLHIGAPLKQFDLGPGGEDPRSVAFHMIEQAARFFMRTHIAHSLYAGSKD